MSLDLNDLTIKDFDIPENLSGLSDGHGLTEVGASSQTGNNSCAQGSCSTGGGIDPTIIFNQ